MCVCVCASPHSINILKYIIYGLAAGFFVFGVLLLVEGFFTTGAIRDLYGEFKITACGRCLTAFVSKHVQRQTSCPAGVWQAFGS